MIGEGFVNAATALSTAQAREADRRAIEEIGIPSAVLMNNAGDAVFREIERGPVGILCGKGNNGGDGFVVARFALLAGYDPTVLLLADSKEIAGDAALFKNAYEKLGGSVVSIASEEAAVRELQRLADSVVLVDALLGTGIQGEVRPLYRTAIESLPDVPVIAVDIPSGMDADTGEACGCCVRADVTVTFQFSKRGFENRAAQAYLGRLVVADIGIPEICGDDSAWQAAYGS